MNVVVDKETCIGCGMCPTICPEVFDMDGDKAYVKQQPTEELPCVQEAIDSCPVAAISAEGCE